MPQTVWTSSSSSSASKRNHKSDLAAAFARVLEQLFMKGGGPSAPPIRTVELVDAAQGLNHALSSNGQQDAQEFNKLFLTFLEDSLRLSPARGLRDLVPSQFRGESCYRTVCQACKKPSASSGSK